MDRNWVLKRKRRRTPIAADPSNEKESTPLPSDPTRSNNSSSKKKLKGGSDVPESAQKIKGHDGYYYECVECDLGGSLLCCDSCPRTYHLECLDPPLKRTPPGKWQCPKCCEGKDTLTPVGSTKSNSRRARTRRIFENANIQKPHSSENSIPGKNKTNDKGKVPSHPRSSLNENQSDSSNDNSSYSMKSKQSCDGKSRDRRKKRLSPFSWSKHSTEFHLLVKTSKLGPIEKSPEKMSNEPKSEIKTEKLTSSSLLASQKSKKKKQQDKRLDKKKKSRTEKLKHVSSVCSDSSEEAFSGSAYRELIPKRKSSDRQKSGIVRKEDSKKLKSSYQKQHEISAISAPSAREFEEKEAVREKTMKSHGSPWDGVQQVDRILGCRVQTSCSVSDNDGKVLTEYYEGKCFGSQKDIKGALREESLSLVDCNDGNKDADNTISVDEEYSGKLRQTKECLDKDEVLTSTAGPSKDLSTSGKHTDLQEDIIINEANIGEETSKSNVSSLEHFPLSQPCDLEGTNRSKMGTKAGDDLPSVIYEFLVKWVGRSNIHNSWISESLLKSLAKRKLENYKAKYGLAVINICEEQWSQPQRVIALRVSKDGSEEALVKWCSLSYDECTWERLDEPVVKKFAHLVTEFKNFESQTLEKDARSGFPRARGDAQELVSLVEQPKELQGGMLFPHQLEALNWLRKCWYRNRNVILADEMGLGKTVSACAFMSSLYCEFRAKLPCLILVPLSTMPNWLAEFASWAPHLNVVEYHGGAKARSIIRQYEWHASDPIGSGKATKAYKFNVLLTTYEMVLADACHLRSVSWEVLLVDEGHRLKNSGSKLFSMLNTFSFQHRVLLTGTPLQNNIGEMYNLLNFLQPDSFPCLLAFEEKFNDLTTAEKVEELKKLVSPHMLRRLKRDAMQNIPPKTERMVPVELTSIQAEYYRAMLTKNYQILRNMGKGAVQQSMLNIVMQLRKVCNHPYLIPGTEPESGSVEFLHEMRIKASAKLMLLHQMLKILERDGHRVLIFSQMTKLLDILEDYLTIEFGPKTFERVDGSVSVADRQAAIARFNQDKSRFVFLLSTRSCGLGINLATADTVIIYDSDFNPHADIQAMNRAHRIGQSSRLLVYRLVVRASVEERILQLAKKKLMLDQLFVNKSESQKEVEDILRWGTEELFNDSDGTNGQDQKEASMIKDDVVVADGEHKHRRRLGGLGDVYQDKCAGGSTKIVWDDNAILKLLDRSDLQSAVSESPDGDLGNDMLGTVKSVEWNDEVNEEPGVAEALPSITGDGREQAEAKEENPTNGTEENEWDRLLRVRWEKYQLEEEAALGRGKRLRKAVSYRETFATIPSEALTESSEEEDEPKPEYTPAGRAWKEKYAKLRARQKDRIARRHTMEISSSTGPQEMTELQPIPPSLNDGEALNVRNIVQETRLQGYPINQEETMSESTTKTEKFLKNTQKKYRSTNLDLSIRIARSNPSEITGAPNSMPPPHLLPVLGLCAPTADEVNAYRNSRSVSSQSEKRGTGNGMSELPFMPTPNADHSTEPNINGKTAAQGSMPPHTLGEALHLRLKNIIPNSYFPSFPFPPPTSGRGPHDPLQSSGSSFASFQEKLGLPNLVLDDNAQTKYAIPPVNFKPPVDLFPGLSLGTNKDYPTDPIQGMPNVPLMPNFAHHIGGDISKGKHQIPDLPTFLGLGQMQATHPSLTESHKKVLDNIMMRTQSATNKLKKKLKSDAWSEEELDALWIGVRRHGKGNWEAMLRDPKLKFAHFRTLDDLSTRWAEEQHKVFDEPASSAPKSSRPPTFPGITDGMMTRALLGSKFSRLGTEPPKFRSHLTDMQLGFGDLRPGFLGAEAANFVNKVVDKCSLLPIMQLDNVSRSTYAGEYSTGPFDGLDKFGIGLEPSFQHRSPFIPENFGAVDINCPSNMAMPHNQVDLGVAKNLPVPGVFENPLNMFHDLQSNARSGESSRATNLDPKMFSANSRINTYKESSSSKSNSLPHWLREAVNAPPSRPPEPVLPPTVSAIAQSVRLLYGEEKPMIPLSQCQVLPFPYPRIQGKF
uniref:Protein CHROMATIN REMODELING 4 n=1 Tax=Ananas comosus var. bracteatus TaxID=296719 RepID=A0A6V7NKI8_ANACO|nr:unnamed protein product [Ananas comosus var. bracteatus]